MKNFILVVLAVAVVGFGYWYTSHKKAVAPIDGRFITEEIVIDDTDGKLKVINFSGKLEKAHPGCFVDGECYVEIDGKHVTVVMGWSHETVGSLIGVESFGDLEKHIGEEFEVYAQDKGNGVYTLYGSQGFYVKLKNSIER